MLGKNLQPVDINRVVSETPSQVKSSTTNEITRYWRQSSCYGVQLHPPPLSCNHPPSVVHVRQWISAVGVFICRELLYKAKLSFCRCLQHSSVTTTSHYATPTFDQPSLIFIKIIWITIVVVEMFFFEGFLDMNGKPKTDFFQTVLSLNRNRWSSWHNFLVHFRSIA